MEIKHHFAIITLDGENLGKHGLHAGVLALGLRSLRLEEILVGCGLEFDQVRRGDDLFDFAEINTFSGSRWHLDLFLLVRSQDQTVFLITTQGKGATFNRELAELTDSGVCRNPALIRLETNLTRGESGATPFKDVAPTYRPVIT